MYLIITLQQRENEILPVEDPSFENEINGLMLESDKEENIHDCSGYETEFEQSHVNERTAGEGSSITGSVREE